MRKLILLIFIIFVIELYAADVANQGIKGGFNFSKINVEGNYSDIQSKLIIGAYSRYKSESFLAFQGESYVSWKGGNIDGVNYDVVSFDFIYLDIDLLARIGIENSSSLEPYFLLGPYMGIKLSGEIESVKINNMRALDFGGVFAVGVKIDKFSIEYRYSPGMSSIISDFSMKNSVSSLLFGFEIKKKSLY